MATRKQRDDTPPKFDAATEAELDAAAEITADDIAGAKESYRRHASPAFRTLLDAEPIKE